LVFLAVIDAIRDGSPSASNAQVASAPTAQPDLNLKTIGSGAGGNALPCPATQAEFSAMTDALASSDNAGYQQSLADGVVLDAGDRVRIIGRSGPLMTVVHLRVLSGIDKDRDCGIAGDGQGLFVGS
jgi:hypothetical protein